MNIFITGNPKCGKSTLIQKILDKISNKKVSGFITPEIRVNNQRQGFKIIDLASGQKEIMAHINIRRGPGVSRYKVDVEAIDTIIDKFLESYRGSEYVIIDEIGMMEFYSKKFKETIEMVLDSDKIVIATLSRKLIKKYKDKGKVYYLTREKFDETYNQAMCQIKS